MDDLRDLAVKKTGKMPVRDPRTGLPLKFSDGTEPFIEFASPDSDRALSAFFAMQDTIRDSEKLTDRERDALKVELLANVTVNWNLRLDGKALPCTVDDAKRLYASEEFAFLRTQGESWMERRANFMLPLPKSSEPTPDKPQV